MKFWQIRNAAGPDEAELLVYGEIGTGYWSDVNAKAFVRDLKAIKAKRIRVRINSVGGDLFGGLGMYNALREHSAEVVSVVEGLAASAASLVALAGDRIVMRRGTMLMIHAPAAAVTGDAPKLRAAADVLDKARDSIVSIYEKRTGKPFDELRALVDSETWMTAAEAVAHGFADSVDEEAPATVLAAREGLLVAASLAFPVETVPAGVALVASLAATQDSAADEPPEEPAAEPDPAATEPPEDPEATEPVPPPGALTAESVVATVRTALGVAAAPLAAALLADGGALAVQALEATAPAIVAALRASGATAERARLAAIDDLELIGHDALVAGAKYGPKPLEAEALALQVVQAERGQRAQYLADRAKDAVGAIVPAAVLPVDTAAQAQNRAAAAMVAGANARRGGMRR